MLEKLGSFRKSGDDTPESNCGSISTLNIMCVCNLWILIIIREVPNDENSQSHVAVEILKMKYEPTVRFLSGSFWPTVMISLNYWF